VNAVATTVYVGGPKLAARLGIEPGVLVIWRTRYGTPGPDVLIGGDRQGRQGPRPTPGWLPKRTVEWTRWRKRADWPKTPATTADRQPLVLLSIPQIAERLGVTAERVRMWHRLYGDHPEHPFPEARGKVEDAQGRAVYGWADEQVEDIGRWIDEDRLNLRAGRHGAQHQPRAARRAPDGEGSR
jgi:hypothetical protein